MDILSRQQPEHYDVTFYMGIRFYTQSLSVYLVDLYCGELIYIHIGDTFFMLCPLLHNMGI